MSFEAIAIDGNTLRGSAKCGARDAHLRSAFSQRLGVVLGQIAGLAPPHRRRRRAHRGGPRGVIATAIPDVEEAVRTALTLAGPDGIVCATGSLYLVGAVRRSWVRDDTVAVRATSLP